MKNHLVFDYETLSDDSTNCVTINCAYMIVDFDRFNENPYTFEELCESMQFAKFKISEQTAAGWKTKKSTIDFWMKQEEEVKKQLVPSKDDIEIRQFVENLKDYLEGNKVKRWWSRGNNFDPVILRRMFEYCNIDLNGYLRYSNIRDIRTCLDTLAGFDDDFDVGFIPPTVDESKFKKHDSIQDVSVDILRLQYFLSE